MRKTQYGKETTFIFEPERPLSLEDIRIGEVLSTFHPSPELVERIRAEWDPKVRGDDGPKWRYEGHTYNSQTGTLSIGVSPIMYSQHFVLRSIPDLRPEEYPTAFTVNSLQLAYSEKGGRTKRRGEQDLLMAVRDFGKGAGGSDQKGLAAFGSGFCDRLVDKKTGKTLPPSHPFLWNMREMLHEGEYDTEFPFDFANSSFLGLVRGSNKDVAAIFYQPLTVFSSQVSLNPDNLAPNGKPEHIELWTLPATPERLNQFLKEGGMNGALAPDHLLGGIELMLKYWNDLMI